MIFVDTSALLATLSLKDRVHPVAKQTWDHFVISDVALYCNNYLLVEAFSLIQNRLGMNAVRELQDNMLPLIQIEWITTEQHQLIIKSFLTANRRQLSLVDCSSFATMRRLGIKQAFTFDPHFVAQGFEVIPGK